MDVKEFKTGSTLNAKKTIDINSLTSLIADFRNFAMKLTVF